MKKESGKIGFLHKPIYSKIGGIFLPTVKNDYKPKVLRPKHLGSIVAFLLIVKVLSILLLFFLYPDFANMSVDVHSRIIELTNQSRTESGLHKLNIDSELSRAAQAKAEDMILNNYFSHDTPSGKKPWQWIDKNNYDYSNAGENLAMNFNSADIAHLALMQSPTHKKNILNPKYKDIGVSVLTGEIDNRKTMILVEMFGKRKDENINNRSEFIKKEDFIENKAPVSSVSVSNDLNNKEISVVENYPLLSADDSVGSSHSSMANMVALDGGDVYVMGVSTDEKKLTIEPKATRESVVVLVSNYTTYLLYFGLIFLIVVLLLNIFIEIKIQHPVLIFHGVLAIIIIFMAINKLNFVHKLIGSVILG